MQSAKYPRETRTNKYISSTASISMAQGAQQKKRVESLQESEYQEVFCRKKNLSLKQLYKQNQNSSNIMT